MSLSKGIWRFFYEPREMPFGVNVASASVISLRDRVAKINYLQL